MKVRLTESQFKKIQPLLRESMEDSKYSREIKVYIDNSGSLFKGKEINDITISPITVTFDIEIDARSWGIKGIELTNVSGPTQVEAEVDYYIDNDNTTFETIIINLDWDHLMIEKGNATGIFTIGDELEIALINDEQGNLVVHEMSTNIQTL